MGVLFIGDFHRVTWIGTTTAADNFLTCVQLEVNTSPFSVLTAMIDDDDEAEINEPSPPPPMSKRLNKRRQDLWANQLKSKMDNRNRMCVRAYVCLIWVISYQKMIGWAR